MPEVARPLLMRAVLVLLGLGAFAFGVYYSFRGYVLPAVEGSTGGFFANLFKSYTPRQECMYREAPVVWLHLVSDLLIGIAYFSIPVALVYFVRRRQDLAFHWMFWMFAVFILACGSTHLIGVLDLWRPMYKVDGLVKAGTAAVSIATAIMLWPLIPKALALPSHATLEQRVQERTAELAQTNRALTAARSQAERASRMKDEFLATLSHELRTPLQAVLGWAQLLQAPRTPQELEQGLAIITRNAQAQQKLIEDLLDMSRITSGRLRLDLTSVDMAEVVRESVASALPGADAKEIVVQSDLGQEPLLVTGDAARLQQVAWNLLSNAVKFTPRGGRVAVQLRRVESQVELAVADDGQGIEPEFLPQLFQRFQQADASASRRHGGLGIGLALVRHIVELHGGTVRAESEGAGKGATFVIRLPLCAPLAELEQVLPRASRSVVPSQLPAILDGVRVVVIDDDLDAQQLIEAILRNAGATVHVAASAPQGLELLHRVQPDVLLCDLGLPGEDGFALIRRVRGLDAAEGGRTPAVAVTAFARSGDRTRALLAGFHVHVAKPFDADELIATVAGLLGLQRRTDGTAESGSD